MIWLYLLCSFTLAEPILDSPTFSYLKQEQIEAGAKAFAQTCYSCHSMQYMRTDQISLDAGINPESAPSWDPSSWNGHPPPDLSLMTAAKGVDFVYSYLRAYYRDESHPSGYENLVLQGTQMPNPFAIMQGDQVLVSQEENQRLFQALRLEKRGSMSPQEFNEYVTSIVAYLNYASDPNEAYRKQVGMYVLGFLAVMILIMIALDLAYWQKIHEDHGLDHTDDEID